MRDRRSIEQDTNNSTEHTEYAEVDPKLTLEVLLDIRDILQMLRGDVMKLGDRI